MSDYTKRQRALAVPGSLNANWRYALYRNAYKRINQRIDAGFCLEAIALTESLLADRLESRSIFLGEDLAFKTLEKLTTKLGTIETDSDLKAVITDDVTRWKNERNKALHEMAKLEEGDDRDWAARIGELKDVAGRGLKVLRSVDRHLKRLRKLLKAAQHAASASR